MDFTPLTPFGYAGINKDGTRLFGFNLARLKAENPQVAVWSNVYLDKDLISELLRYETANKRSQREIDATVGMLGAAAEQLKRCINSVAHQGMLLSVLSASFGVATPTKETLPLLKDKL